MQDPLPSLPHDTPWWGYLIAIVVGGAGLRFAQTWLESRRLEKKDYRELLQCHIDKQRGELDALTVKLDTTQNGRIAALEKENTELRAKVAVLEVHVAELETQLRMRQA